MKKLKLKNLSAIGNVLTSEELKHVYGGSGSGSGSGSVPIPPLPNQYHCEWDSIKKKCIPNPNCPEGTTCMDLGPINQSPYSPHFCATILPAN